MKRQYNQVRKYRGGFLSLLGMLISLIIVGLLVYFAFNAYFKVPVLDKQTEESVSKAGVDTSSPVTIINSTRKTVDDINKKMLKQSQDLEKDLIP